MSEHPPSAQDSTVIRRRVRGEFLEMPGLRLTEAQAERLWGLDERTCSALLESLVEDGFLSRTSDGRVRRSDCRA